MCLPALAQSFHPSPLWNVTHYLRLFGLQGGGLEVQGKATLINTNVSSNDARSVCCLNISSIAPMERYALQFLACRAVASLSEMACRAVAWILLGEWLTLNTAISMRTPLLMCACIFELSRIAHPSPLWNVTCFAFWLQGGGLHLSGSGTATLTNTIVYSNTASHNVCSPSALA